MASVSRFDSVLLLAFGGPEGMDDVRPFLDHVLRGKRVPPQRLEEVVTHYQHFQGISPINEITRHQAEGLRERLAERGLELPVYLGMRNWHPFIADTLKQMASDGRRRAIGVIASAHQCYSSCGEYKEGVRSGQRQLLEADRPLVDVTYVDNWATDEGFIATVAAHTQQALDRFEPDLRQKARIVFTAHSIPHSMADHSGYVAQLEASAALVARRLERTDYALVYQSRSGRPTDPWLEPDVCDYLEAERGNGLEAVVVVPIGFICDHIEVLWDLDVEVAEKCRALSLPMQRAETVNDDPLFVDALAHIVQEKYERYSTFPLLPIVAADG